MTRIRGYIFDLDGVVSDTQKLHSRVESELLSRFGVALTPQEITIRYSGVRTRDFMTDLLTPTGQTFDMDALMDEKWQRMTALAHDSVEEVPGATALINRLFFEGPLAVGSASVTEYVRCVLYKLYLRDHFQTIICGDMVERGKPDPEIFLCAASEIRVPPSQCLVFEDGISGMEAARRAGMRCIGLVRDKTLKYPTQHLVTSLAEVTPEFIAGL